MSDDVAETLRRAWTTALDATVDDGDDFFALGGDSLRAASVAADLHQHIDVLIEPGWLYDHRDSPMLTHPWRDSSPPLATALRSR